MGESLSVRRPESSNPSSLDRARPLRSPGLGGLSRPRETAPYSALIEEFAMAWRRGERTPAEIFLEQHAFLAQEPEAAIRLIYEEVCLRQGEGEDVRPSELARRFPRWRSELQVLLDCDRLLAGLPGPPAFPEPGETLGDFHLLAELGRGGRGRCFLAAQPSLSHRQVVLKVTPDDHLEHLSMSRLQHTHIMPLYSEHEFPARRLRALCMPYLGGATLARLLEGLRALPPNRRSGRAILEILDAAQAVSPRPGITDSPARRFLLRSSYVRAVCWIGACLADALEYAHERGLVHMDVKPSNVLLTGDGQPMLLDFHLAREPIQPGEVPAEGLGGTPSYMSPEQAAAVASLDAGKPSTACVDARADLYALGCVLAEMLAMEPPAASPPVGLVRTGFAPGVTTGLSDVLRKSLATDPANRYPAASVLAEDLRRHMADQPLRGVPNRSLKERWQKWCRRRPIDVFRVQTLFLAVTSSAVVGGMVWIAFVAPRSRAAAGALVEGRLLLERRDYPAAARALTRGAALIEGLPGGQQLARELGAALRLTDRLLELERLHRLVDRLRLAESAADGPLRTARDVERNCRSLWASRNALLRPDEPALDLASDRRLRDDLLDLAIIGASLGARLETEPARVLDAHRNGLRLLNQAEALLGPSHVLHLARQTHARALGLSALADQAARGAALVPPRTAWEHDAAGRVLLASGDLSGAEAAFEQAIALCPQDLWPHFHRGICAFRAHRFADAVAAFDVCVALAPDRAECVYNRALSHAALGDQVRADRDFDRADALDSTLAAKPLDRSSTRRPSTAR